MKMRPKVFFLSDECLDQIAILMAQDKDMTASSLVRALIAAEFTKTTNETRKQQSE
jgi:hypothetical protein